MATSNSIRSLPIGRNGDTEAIITVTVASWSWYLSSAPSRINLTLACRHGDDELRLGTVAHPSHRNQILVAIKCSENELKEYLLELQSLSLLVEDAVRSRLWATADIPVVDLAATRKVVGTFPALDTGQRGIGCLDVDMTLTSHDGSSLCSAVNDTGKVDNLTQGSYRRDLQVQSLLERLEIDGEPDPLDLETAASFEIFEVLVEALQRCDRPQHQPHVHTTRRRILCANVGHDHSAETFQVMK
jgi:hypothetical protein